MLYKLQNGFTAPAALMAYRASPLRNGYSPAELLFGRLIRTTLPADLPPPAWPDLEDIVEEEQHHQDQQATIYNSRHRTKVLKPLLVGSAVFVPDLNRKGTITWQATDRSYDISSGGSTIRRNRQQLRPLPTAPVFPTEKSSAPSNFAEVE